MFQEPRLLPWLTVADNIGFGLDGRRPERRDRIARALERVGLADKARAWPRDLSGGQQQRVSIARAFVARPGVLLLDEPFSALDAFTRSDLHDHLLALWAETRPTILLVTHDVGEAVVLADRVVVMRPRPGRLDETCQADAPRDPASPQSEAAPRDWPRSTVRSTAEARPPRRPSGTGGGSGRRGVPANRDRRRPRWRTTMDATTLRALQAPLKERYKQRPAAAVITLKAKGSLDDTKIACKVETGRALAVAGPAPGDRRHRAELCSGDMLLEALVACAGVTLKAVATALEFPLRAASCAPRAISISAARSASTRRRRSASARSGCASTSTPTRRRTSSTAAQADRALLRGVPDHQERPEGLRQPAEGLVAIPPLRAPPPGERVRKTADPMSPEVTFLLTLSFPHGDHGCVRGLGVHHPNVQGR